MAINGLLALRELLAAEVSIEAFFTEHYGVNAKHLLGYKKAPKTSDYPYFAYVPVKSTSLSHVDNELVSLVIGINEPTITDDAMQGHIQLSAIVDLLEPIIKQGRISEQCLCLGDYDNFGDFGERHPFYETELQIRLIWRKQ